MIVYVALYLGFIIAMDKKKYDGRRQETDETREPSPTRLAVVTKRNGESDWVEKIGR